MTIAGIVVEYNPLHLGHMHHIEKTKELLTPDVLVAVMSSNVVQRGEFSVVDKFTRTRWALQAGVDIVVELPGAYVLQSANIFAHTAIQLLNHLGVSDIVFGSEHGHIDAIKTSAEIMRTHAYDEKIQGYLAGGDSYPVSAHKALKSLSGTSVHEHPNDILGIQYINAIHTIGASITPHVIKRIQSGYHEGFHEKKSIQSATALRNQWYRGRSIDDYVPSFIRTKKHSPLNTASAYPFMKYRLLTHSAQTLADIFSFDDGIEGHFLNNKDAQSLSDLLERLSSKRYTHAKIKRSLIHMLIDTKKDALKDFTIPYARILGMRESGQRHLNAIKKNISVPLITKIRRDKHPLLTHELTITRLHDFLNGTTTIDEEFKPVIIL